MTNFNLPFGPGNNEWPLVKDRYRLIWAQPCPYATRAKIAHALLGLEDVISIGMVHPVNNDVWEFSLDQENHDPVLQVENVREFYEAADPNYDGVYSVPLLVDIKSRKIVRK